MQEVIFARKIRKTFTLTRKQRRLEKTGATKKVALDGLDFTA